MREVATRWYNQSYAFGTVLSEGQSLHHEFLIRNPLDHPIRLIHGMALTPCCSSIGPLPDSIPARGEATIPTSFNPGYQSGVKEVRFLIETDSEFQERIQLALRTQLVSTWEVASLEEATTNLTLPLRRAGSFTLRVVSRRIGDRGRGLPDSISASPPIKAAFSGDVRSSITSGGMVEAARDVEVALPASDRPGLKAGEIVFAWSAGLKETMPLGWNVRPSLMLTPAGLVLKRSARLVKRTIVVVSDGLPFRLIEVASPLLGIPVDLPAEPAARHTVDLDLDLSGAPSDRTYDVRITTDHADQASVYLSVLILSGADEEGG